MSLEPRCVEVRAVRSQATAKGARQAGKQRQGQPKIQVL